MNLTERWGIRLSIDKLFESCFTGDLPTYIFLGSHKPLCDWDFVSRYGPRHPLPIFFLAVTNQFVIGILCRGMDHDTRYPAVTNQFVTVIICPLAIMGDCEYLAEPSLRMKLRIQIEPWMDRSTAGFCRSFLQELIIMNIVSIIFFPGSYIFLERA
jgi:hypothetical protein